MRLIMMGTGPFAVPTFRSLLDSEHQLLALFTRPTSAWRGRGKMPASPMRDVAETSGVNIYGSEDVNRAEAQAQLKKLAPDLLVVCDYGQILSRQTLASAQLGGINLHGSLLPKYRGAAPINWAIYHGETTTGVTIIHMSPKLDAGPSLVQRQVPIGPEETAVQLEQRLAQLGVEPVYEAIRMLADWDGRSPIGQAQDASLVSNAPRLKKHDGLVDWSRTAEQIKNQVRAFKPWPGTFTYWHRPDGPPLRLNLDQVAVIADATIPGHAGRVAHCDGRQLWVSTGEGHVAFQRVQPAGKRIMSIDDFLRGYPVHEGDRLASGKDD